METKELNTDSTIETKEESIALNMESMEHKIAASMKTKEQDVADTSETNETKTSSIKPHLQNINDLETKEQNITPPNMPKETKENIKAAMEIEKENMDVTKVFRNLAIGHYMEDFDYITTNFAFKAVYHTNAYSYCFCTCAFEHERIDYIIQPGKINEKMYQRVLQCILDGKCEHVDQLAKEYTKKTRVYGIHIAVAAGTVKPLKDFQDPTSKCYGEKARYGHMLAYRWLYQLDPYQVALVKNWEVFQVPELFWFIYDHDWQEFDKLCYLDARRVNLEQSHKTVQMHFMTCLELCVRNENVEVLKRYMDTISEDNPIHIRKALQLAFTHNLNDIPEIILHYKNWISECLLSAHIDYKWIEEICELTIIYDKPKFLDDLLNEMMTQMSQTETKFHAHAKQEGIALVQRLIQICETLQKQDLKAVISKFQHKLKGDMSNETCTLSDLDQTKILGILLMKHNLPVETCISFLKLVPNVSAYINHTDEIGSCLHAFHWFIVSEYQRRPTFLKQLMDLGASVNCMDEKGMTPLIHLINMNIYHKYPNPREAEELYIYQNPDIEAHKSIISYAIKADQISHKFKYDNIASGFRVRCDYLMDGKLHGKSGHDDADFALNFMVPFLIEAGFPVSESERKTVESAMDTLHPAEQEYLQLWFTNPRPLKLRCRDVLRGHFTGREIHRHVKMANIPQTIKDFILLKPLLKCVSNELLD